jgi:hypothetical protein
MPNISLMADWDRLPRIASTLVISLMMMAGYLMSAMGLFVIFTMIFGPGRLGSVYLTLVLLVAALPVFWVLAVGALGVWRWRYRAWQRPPATSLGLGVAPLTV